MLLSDHLIEHYRPNIGIILFNLHGEVWLGQRPRSADAFDPLEANDLYRWQLPQGGIDPGEAVEQAAFRELAEETGVRSAMLVMVTPGWLAYDFPLESQRKRWRGQRQKWAVMLFSGDESEIDIAADDHQEFDQWRWAEIEEVPGLIVPFKRQVYAEIVSAILPLRLLLREGALRLPITPGDL